jgi:hypothetical protein
MPIRKIPLNRRSVTGLVNSKKNNRMVMSESTLERDLLILMEFDLNVESFEEQPLTIEYRDINQKQRLYTPDILVRYRKDIAPAMHWRPILCEVKYRTDLFANWEELKPKFKAGREYARQQGWQFHILTEKEIRTPYLENAKFLLRYRNTEIDWNDADRLLKTIGARTDASPQELLEACSTERMEQARLLTCVWQLISRGFIGADIEMPLTMISPIWCKS